MPYISPVASIHPLQPDLFDGQHGGLPSLPVGFDYESGFLSLEEEAGLIAVVKRLPLESARYKTYTARRRVLNYGGCFDFDANRLRPAEDLHPDLMPLRDRIARWMDIPPQLLAHALVAEYQPGSALGWHRDVPDFEQVVGVSLGAEAVMRFRPYASNPRLQPPTELVRLTVEPRSLYRMRAEARWDWQHSMVPTRALRWSITFRTARGAQRLRR